MLGNLRVTVTTGSMNRLEPLRQALPTWLALPEVDQVIIVDWGSSPPLSYALRDFIDPRILIGRVTDQRHWQNSKCHNLEIRLASRSDLLLRLDNDTLVRPDFFAHHPPKPHSFYAVNWRTVPREVDDKRNLAGTLLINPRDLLRVNGYNERLVHYGREDDDLHARLMIEGIRWYPCKLETLEHIPHTDRERIENLEAAPELLQLQKMATAEERIWGVRVAPKQALISMNEKTIAETPWTKHDLMTSWEARQIDDRYWECKAAYYQPGFDEKQEIKT